MKTKPFQYPEVHLPDAFDNVMMSRPTLPTKPTAPQKPTPPTIPKKDDGSDKSFFGWMSLFAIVMCVFMVSKCDSFSAGDVFQIAIPLVLVGGFSIMMFVGLSKGPSADDKYKQDMADYYNKLSAYNNSISMYDAEVKKYQASLARYEKRVKEILSEENLSYYRSEKIEKLAKTVSDRTGTVLSQAEAKKGPSEEFFYGTLKALETMGWAVYSDSKIPVGNSFFYPDFTLVDASGLCFDVEIDEPYSLDDGSPIHYRIDTSYSHSSVDHDRNSFFKKKGWVIIRFSEKEIYKDPTACVNFIISVRNHLFEGKTGEYEYPDNLCEPKWTADESHKMAYRHARNDYIRSMEEDDSIREYSIE